MLPLEPNLNRLVAHVSYSLSRWFRLRYVLLRKGKYVHQASSKKTILGLLFLTLFLGLAGCGGDDKSEEEQDVDGKSSENLRAIESAYRAASTKLRRAPRSKRDLEKHFPEGTDKASVYRSPRDKKDYVIVWGTDLKPLMTKGPVVIGYEKDGRNGMRYTFTSMGFMPMSDDEFSKAEFPKGHKP